MRRFAALLLAAFSICMLLPACTETETGKEPASDRTERPAFSGTITEITFPPNFYWTPNPQKMLLFTFNESSGSNSRIGTSYSVISDEREFEKRFPHADDEVLGILRERDFSSMLVIVIDDTVSTGGYTLTYSTAEVADDKVHIDLKKTSPSPSDMVTQAMVTHTVAVALDRSFIPEGAQISVTINGKPISSLQTDR